VILDQPAVQVQAAPQRTVTPPREPQRKAIALPAKKWTLGIGVGLAVSVPILALLMWMMRPATLVLHWPLDQRRSSRLDVDGEQVPIPSADPAKISLSPGQHRIVVRRRGYDQLEWDVSLARGDRQEQRVEWKQPDAAQGFGFNAGKSP
jgi:hypothetical protein